MFNYGLPNFSRAVLAVLILGSGVARADEGYWLFSDPPTEAIAKKYHVTLTPDWLHHLQGAVIRIGGATGSFVSANGLVITNHHVGEDQLHALSSPEHDYEDRGFFAGTLAEELPCKGMEMLVLHDTHEVTARVLAAVRPGATPAEAEAAHKAVEAAIDQESFTATGLYSEVVTLFGGARYDLYRYKKYTDVRLVFSPDWGMASFGGDPDNFEFPRYDLDVCFFRVYENGKPLKSDDYLRWNSSGPSDGELVFAAGHPGFSQRLITMADLVYQKEVSLPYRVHELERVEKGLEQFSQTSAEHAREAGDLLAVYANARKAYIGFLAGVQSPELPATRGAEETRIRALLAAHPDGAAALAAYGEVEEAVKADALNFTAYNHGERFGSRSDLFNLARSLVRAVDEKAKPNGERLPGFRDSDRPSLEFRLFADRPIYDDLETFVLKDDLEQLPVATEEERALKEKLLAGKSVEARVAELVKRTKLKDIAFRKRVYGAPPAELRALGDPLLDFVLALEPAARAARKIDDEDTEMKRRAYATIYQARVALKQAPLYPDATDTLRLSYGTVSGYTTADGKFVEPLTDFAGLYARSEKFHDQPPFDLPKPWIEQKSSLNPATPFNFASTNDILGGNSGSPVVNAKGEFVGIIFDGDEPSLAGRFVYDPAVNRAVSVDSAAIREALLHIYHADGLVQELQRDGAGP
jgi:hypothetical protein